MTLNFKDPKTKDKVVFILRNSPRLSTKQIHLKLKKAYFWPYSYQAVHKVIKELMDEGIVVKKNLKLNLSDKWLGELKRFLSGKEQKSRYLGSMQIHNFQSIAALDRFLFGFGKEFDRSAKKSDLVQWEASHYWWPIAYSKDMYDIIREREESHKSVKVFLSSTSLDRWCARYYQRLGVQTKFTKGHARYLARYQDTRMEIIIPEIIQTRMDKFFKETESFEKIDLKAFYKDIINRKTNIKVIVQKPS